MVQDKTEEAGRPAPRRRWRTFSLRGLMVLVVAVGGLLGWSIRQATLRGEAIATIRAAGGRLTFRDEDPEAGGWRVWLFRRTGEDVLREVEEVELPFEAPAGRVGDAPGASRPPRDAALRAVGRLGRAEVVTLYGGRVGRAEMESLAGAAVANLGLIGLEAVPDELLAAVGRIRSLRNLRVNWPGTKLTASALRVVGGMTQLESLDLHGFEPLLADDMAPLARLDRLESLAITPSPIDGSVFDRLAALDRLRAVLLLETRITDDQLRRLARLRPGLTTLGCGGALLTDSGAGTLAGLTRLESLVLRGLPPAAPGLTDSTLAAIGTLRALSTLEVTCGRFTSAGLESLAGLPLGNLRLGSIESATPAALGRLLGGRPWILLGLHGPGIGDATVPRLAPFVTARTALILSRTAITDAGAADLAALPARALWLTGTALTDAGLAALARGTSARELVVWDTKITPEGAAAFRAARPRTSLYVGPARPGDD